MKHVLIATIVRNAAPHIWRYADLVNQLGRRLGREGWECSLSLYENDSTDGTDMAVHGVKRELASAYGPMRDVWVTTDRLGTQQYGSVWSIDRLRNLANARQACLDQVGDLSRFDKIAYIEPDVTYDPHWAAELILARHPIAAGVGEPDIYSGWSLRTLKHPKESVFLYDTCATRQTNKDACWSFEREGKWRSQSVFVTDLGGVDSNCLHWVWSTFNCFCVYNARPFIEGLRWDYANARLDTGQTRLSDGTWLDADTAVMCEAFRARGYNGVYLNTNVLIRHA